MTPLQKRLAELKKIAVRDVGWPYLDHLHYTEYARALLALLPVVEAARGVLSFTWDDNGHDAVSAIERLLDAYHDCERALTETVPNEGP